MYSYEKYYGSSTVELLPWNFHEKVCDSDRLWYHLYLENKSTIWKKIVQTYLKIVRFGNRGFLLWQSHTFKLTTPFIHLSRHSIPFSTFEHCNSSTSLISQKIEASLDWFFAYNPENSSKHIGYSNLSHLRWKLTKTLKVSF